MREWFEKTFPAAEIETLPGDKGQWTNRTGIVLGPAKSQVIVTSCDFAYTVRRVGDRAYDRDVAVVSDNEYYREYEVFEEHF